MGVTPPTRFSRPALGQAKALLVSLKDLAEPAKEKKKLLQLKATPRPRLRDPSSVCSPFGSPPGLSVVSLQAGLQWRRDDG